MRLFGQPLHALVLLGLTSLLVTGCKEWPRCLKSHWETRWKDVCEFGKCSWEPKSDYECDQWETPEEVHRRLGTATPSVAPPLNHGAMP
jgi:hypothetical protein